jgi:putative SOS response-associated peptidase YedK
VCGRYSLSTPGELVAEVFALDESLELEPRYNIAPTQQAPIISRSRPDGGRALRLARWGLIPYWAQEASIGNRAINARAETLADLASFKESFRRRRCLVPADGFYEWQKRPSGAKQPYHLTLADGTPFAFAGLFDRWRQAEDEWIESFTIVTTEPNSLLEPIHDRMPAILPREHHARWLDPTVDEPDVLQALLGPYPPEIMLATPVGSLVNSPRNDSARCIEEVEVGPEPENLTLW